MSSILIKEFIIALDQEVDAIKKGNGGNIVKVFNGRFLREVSGLFVYVFNLENFLAVLDEAPAEIEIRGIRYPAQILLTHGLEVEIGIERSCGQYVSEAKLQTNLWHLHELLKKKFIELQNIGVPAVSESLLAGNSDRLPGFDNIVACKNCGTNNRVTNFVPSQILICGRCKQEIRPNYSVSEKQPNSSQKKAINASFFSQLLIIWGPPGTGKTKTIAQAIESHLNAGRRVLLVSHANAAVDEALVDVAEQLEHTPFYEEGKLVRLGVPQSSHLERLTERYPLVLLDKIAGKIGESLLREKHDLSGEKVRIEGVLDEYGTLFRLVQEAKTKSSELATITFELSGLSRKLSVSNDQLRRLEENQERDRKRLQEALMAGPIKRFFRGLDPKNILRETHQTDNAIESNKIHTKAILDRIQKVEDLHAKKQEEVERAKNASDNLLTRAGVSVAELDAKRKGMMSRKDAIQARILEIDQQLGEIQKNILSKAMLIATTLTKTFSARQLPDTPFDTLIVDEASMVPLPHLYWAVSRCRGYITIVGDFLQLPPICIAKEPMAKKWLGRNLFDILGIDQVDKANRDDRVTLLDTQYRMVPEISAIPNKFFYQNILKDDPRTNNQSLDDGVSRSPLVLVETGAMNPWCSKLSSGGRFNLYNALLCCTLAKKIIPNDRSSKIGIMTPYAAQAHLINKIAKDWDMVGHLRISTVHRFQGGEEGIIIFDTVEGQGLKVAPMLDSTKPDSDAKRLLNVAITRAKYRFYLVANTRYLLSGLHLDSDLSKIIHHFYDSAQEIASEQLVDSYFTTDFERWADGFFSPDQGRSPNHGNMYTERNFWGKFIGDIKSTQHRLIIFSPFLSVKRSSIFMDYFRAMKERDINISVHTRPRNQQTHEMAHQTDVVTDQLRSIGVSVFTRSKMHQKIAIIDDAVAWEGSLNILSHKDTEEHMRRFEGPSTVEEIIRNLEIDEEMPVGCQTAERCPEPGCDGYLVIRTKYGRKFFGCSNFAKKKCRYTRSLSAPIRKQADVIKNLRSIPKKGGS